MAKGKHSKRAALRRQQQEREELERRKEELIEEEIARERLDQELAEMEALAEEIAQLRGQVAAIGQTEADALRAEVAELVREVLQLEGERRRRMLKAERNDEMGGMGVEYVEAAIRHVDGEDDTREVVIAVGVDMTGSKKLSVEQIKAIQRARGLRR